MKTYEQKLKEAKERLGNRYVLHPDYNRKSNPAHMFYGSLTMYQVARKAIMEGRIV